MTDLAMPARRLIAVGTVRSHHGRTTRITATPIGVTGTITASTSCTACRGAGGRTETTSSGGVTRQTWIRCATCRGTGRQ